MAFDAQNYIDAVEKWRLSIAAIEARGAAEMERIIATIDRALLAALDVDAPMTDAVRSQVLQKIRTAIRQGAGAAGRSAEARVLEVILATWERDIANLRRIPSARAAVATYLNFEAGIRSGQLFPSVRSGVLGDWAGRWSEYWGPPLRGIQSAIARGQAAGLSGRAIAASIQDAAGVLNVGNRPNPEAFSRMLVRTKLTETAADLAQVMAAEAEIDKFANIGTPDDRQAEECYEASQQDPMTWAEWMEWSASNGKGGPAPRHPNCRCSMAPIPDAVADDDWSQPNPKFEEVSV